MSKRLLLILGFPGVGLFLFAAGNEGLPSLSTLIIPSIVVLLLILVNALFVGAEFAIIGVRPTQVEEMVEAGNTTAIGVMETLASRSKQDQYIATAQLGITITSLGLGMYGEPAIAHFVEPYFTLLKPYWGWIIDYAGPLLGEHPEETLIHGVGYVVALSLLTYLHMVIGEMIPKQLALSDSKQAVLLLARPMEIMNWLFAWPVYLLNGLGNLFLRLIKVPPVEGHERVRSTDELEQIVSESAKEGFLTEEEEAWIINIFNFNQRQVQQVMTPRRKIEAIANNTSPKEILKLVAQSRFSRFPVYQDDIDHIIGILHLKELARHQIAEGKFDLGELVQTVPVVPEYYSAQKLLSRFKRDRIHMAVVLDEFGGTAGIVTLEDLIEEIVGEVRDEFDREQEPMVEIEPGVLEVAGNYLIYDLVNVLENLTQGVAISSDDDLPDVETVGGLIVSKLGRPPTKGDQVVYNDVTFTVLAVDGLAVARTRIAYPASATTDATSLSAIK